MLPLKNVLFFWFSALNSPFNSKQQQHTHTANMCVCVCLHTKGWYYRGSVHHVCRILVASKLNPHIKYSNIPKLFCTNARFVFFCVLKSFFLITISRL